MRISSDRVIVGKKEKKWVSWKSIKGHPFSSQTILYLGLLGPIYIGILGILAKKP